MTMDHFMCVFCDYRSSTNSGDFDGFSVFSKWNVGPKYALQSLVGSGAYGEVAVAINLATNEKVAIKRMPKILNVSSTISSSHFCRFHFLKSPYPFDLPEHR